MYPGPYLLSDGWLSTTAGRAMNWWQLGFNVNSYGEGSAMVEACISAYAQTIADSPHADTVCVALSGGVDSCACLAALMEAPVKFLWTHDAFRVGEDGPTHQPIEQEAQLRLLEKVHNHSGAPGFLVLRPADAASE